jgi:hypothetical protein
MALAVDHDRLRATATFRGAGHDAWRRSRLGIIGAGNLGSRLAIEAVRSGASVWICDPDEVAAANLATQDLASGGGASGGTKVDAVLRACDAIEAGRAAGAAADVRAAGIEPFLGLDLIVDASDDPALAEFLTELSNGLGVPLLRAALDGSGGREYGRVLASHGGAGRACQLCPRSAQPRSLRQPRQPRQPCAARRPTYAGGAIGMAVAGLALLQAQRLLSGNDPERVLDRELLLDLDGFSLQSMALRRSAACISAHVRWSLEPIERGIEETAVSELLDLAARRLGSRVRLRFLGHPLALEAFCSGCGARRLAVGSVHAPAPACPDCGLLMARRRDALWDDFDAAEARELGILESPLGDLGLPRHGSVISARRVDGPPLHLLVRGAAHREARSSILQRRSLMSAEPFDGPRRNAAADPLAELLAKLLAPPDGLDLESGKTAIEAPSGEFFRNNWENARDGLLSKTRKIRMWPIGATPRVFRFEVDRPFWRQRTPASAVELAAGPIRGTIVYQPVALRAGGGEAPIDAPGVVVLLDPDLALLHPNFSRRHGFLCLGRLPEGPLPLEALLIHVYGVLCYENRSTADPADADAAAYFAAVPEALSALPRAEPLY